jgi:hypothetical protein
MERAVDRNGEKEKKKEGRGSVPAGEKREGVVARGKKEKEGNGNRVLSPGGNRRGKEKKREGFTGRERERERELRN